MSVEHNQIKKAITALSLLDAKSKGTKTTLIESTRHYSLVISLVKCQKQKSNPVALGPLPHPFIPPNVCIIVKDPQRTYKDILIPNLECVQKVIGVGKVGKKFHSFESKRKLRDSFDLFLADQRVLPLLPKSLGKTFLKTKSKVPVSVDLTKNPVEAVKTVFESTFMHIGNGTCL